MGLFKKLFGGGSAAEAPQFEIVENNISTDLTRYQVRVRKHGQEMYAEELFQAATKPKDLQFGRFYLLNENPPKLHFAPSLEKAVNWFRGRDLPKDGYYNIFWGEEVYFSMQRLWQRRQTAIKYYQGGEVYGQHPDPDAHGDRGLAGDRSGLRPDGSGDLPPRSWTCSRPSRSSSGLIPTISSSV